MKSEDQFKNELEIFNRSWDYIKNVIPWIHQHYYDDRNTGNEGKIHTRTDLILIESHLDEMMKMCKKWKSDYP